MKKLKFFEQINLHIQGSALLENATMLNNMSNITSQTVFNHPAEN